MTDPIVPAATKLAAKRAALRTFYQTLSSAIPIGAITIGVTGDWWIGVGLGAAGAVASALLAAAAAYAETSARGIPDDYRDATLAQHSVLDPDEQATDLNHAVEVVSQ